MLETHPAPMLAQREANPWRKRIERGAALLVIVLAAGLYPPSRHLLGSFFDWTKKELFAFIEWTQGMGVWGPIYLALFYVVSCVLFLPGSILTAGSGFAFGLVVGTVTASIGSVLGVSAAFLLGRTVARRWVEKKISAYPKFRAIDEAVGREGFKIVLLTRLSPAFPFNLLNYAFAVTRVSFRDFFFASWIGMFPGTVLYVYLGTAAKSLADIAAGRMEGGLAGKIFLGVGLAATVAVTVVLTRVARRALKQTVREEETNHA